MNILRDAPIESIRAENTVDLRILIPGLLAMASFQDAPAVTQPVNEIERSANLSTLMQFETGARRHKKSRRSN